MLTQSFPQVKQFLIVLLGVMDQKIDGFPL